ncbi:unnamed protein product, partial [Rotaria magnacalcarata]
MIAINGEVYEILFKREM